MPQEEQKEEKLEALKQAANQIKKNELLEKAKERDVEGLAGLKAFKQNLATPKQGEQRHSFLSTLAYQSTQPELLSLIKANLKEEKNPEKAELFNSASENLKR